MNDYEMKKFVESELKELESRDADQLYACLQDNASDLGVGLTESFCARLYSEIETQLEDLEALDEELEDKKLRRGVK